MGLHADNGGAVRHCCHPCPTSKIVRWHRQHLALRGHIHLNCRCPPVCASANVRKGDVEQTRPNALRKLLLQPGIVKGPCCHDGLSAKLIEQAGFSMAFMSGFGVAASRLGVSDTNLLSYSEVLDQGRNLLEATEALPIIGDGDTGFGNALSVKRTVNGFANAGFAGILIEDQAAPKSCGHVRGKKVVSRGEAVARIRAAVDARDEGGSNVVIVARTDARQAESLDEALWRTAAFADAGADVLFIDALESKDEMRAFCSAGTGASSLPKMANMLEGGGKTPVLAPEELEQLGFKLVAYPLSLLGVSIRAMQSALQLLKAGQLPPASMMPSFQDIQETVGFPEYFTQAERYAVKEGSSTSQVSTSASSYSSSPGSGQAAAAGTRAVGTPSEQPTSAAGAGAQRSSAAAEPVQEARRRDSSGLQAVEERQEAMEDRVVDATEIMAEGQLAGLDDELRDLESGGDGSSRESSGARASMPVVEPDAIVVSGTSKEPRGSSEDATTALRRARFLRVKISESATGAVRLETRLPSQFVDGMAAVIPQVAGVDLEQLVREVNADWTKEKPIADFQAGTERVQIYLDGLA